jgi:hypothetical protein
MDRKELLRTLVSEVVVTVKEQPRCAQVEIVWEGGARTELTVPLIRRGPEGDRTSDDTIELVRSSPRTAQTSRSPRSSTSRAAAPAPACRSTSHASCTCAPSTACRPHRRRIPTAACTPSSRLPSSWASPRPRSTDGCAPGSCEASRPPRARRGGTASPTMSAASRARRPRRLPAAGRRRQAPLRGAADRFAQGPTRRAARRPRVAIGRRATSEAVWRADPQSDPMTGRARTALAAIPGPKPPPRHAAGIVARATTCVLVRGARNDPNVRLWRLPALWVDLLSLLVRH